MTTNEAADRLRIKPRSVVWAITQGHITATKHGRDYWIEDTEVERYAIERKAPHRPKKD